ncbi:MAG: hypothetical protein ACTSRZ_19780 [Promethearchaeota archaeon]
MKIKSDILTLVATFATFVPKIFLEVLINQISMKIHIQIFNSFKFIYRMYKNFIRVEKKMEFNEEGIMKVSDVSEEYIYISNLKCENCGNSRSIKVNLQKLVFEYGKPYDILEAKCKICGKEYEFKFDVSECFKKYDQIFKN